MPINSNIPETNEEIVLEDNQIICALTDQIKPAVNLQLKVNW